MRLLTNPILFRAATVGLCSAFFFMLGLLFVRSLRKKISEEAEEMQSPAISMETLPLNLYNTVIQQLKQQKHDLQVQTQAEQHRARTSENFSHAVLSNLSCGVLVFGANGLVKTSNVAAKAILGFGAINGMSAPDIFRSAASEAASFSGDSGQVHIADEIHAVLREGSKRRQAEGEYQTPSGETRFLSMTVSQVPAVDGSLLGVACLVNDLTELRKIRQQQELHGELSAEMALQLRTSLATIAGYAQQLASNRDPDLAKQLAVDIAQEAAQLDRSIGGFLTAKPAARSAAAGR
ncbi:MAG TPA: PAS domain-containing protein [Candidatus Acidoferrales bacterium]|nr:PAS domain-containing protein [Candidatus Acidoferrales bacterium]